MTEEIDVAANFIEEIVDDDIRSGLCKQIVTRFPPEPNGYLHIGHAKSIVLNFGVAARHPGGRCSLRFDDTNPIAEESRYVDAIRDDVHWLGFDCGESERFASDYFEQLYGWAISLIERGLAYVDSQSSDEIREMRGDFYRLGINSCYRDRSVQENLDLFRRMRAGELADGSHVLRAKIDMQHPDVLMRDPLMYRIRHAHHHRTGDDWPIYPMYDYAHPLSDAIEGVTHSLCTLEFAANRRLYDWFVGHVNVAAVPHQIEFARLNLSYTVLSKRKLTELVEKGIVSGWDDPRMPTIAGMRRRGYPPAAIRKFCEAIGVARRDNVVDMALLEHGVRDELNASAPRVMAVLRPLRLVIENFPEDEVLDLDCPYMPGNPSAGSRIVPFSRVLYVEADDFAMDPHRKWFRLALGREVRLRYACIVTCNDVVRDPYTGEVVELRCTWDPDSVGGTPADGRKVKGTLHWVSAAHAIDAEVRLYDRLFDVENPMAAEPEASFLDHVNSHSLNALPAAKVEPSLADAKPADRVQFERLGYFCVDPDTTERHLVLNRTVSLRDSWAKIAKKEAG